MMADEFNSKEASKMYNGNFFGIDKRDVLKAVKLVADLLHDHRILKNIG